MRGLAVLVDEAEQTVATAQARSEILHHHLAGRRRPQHDDVAHAAPLAIPTPQHGPARDAPGQEARDHQRPGVDIGQARHARLLRHRAQHDDHGHRDRDRPPRRQRAVDAAAGQTAIGPAAREAEHGQGHGDGAEQRGQRERDRVDDLVDTADMPGVARRVPKREARRRGRGVEGAARPPTVEQRLPPGSGRRAMLHISGGPSAPG